MDGPLLQTIALGVILVAAGWLLVVGLVCAIRPELALAKLGRMGSTWPIQIGEHGLRALAGAALVVRADYSGAPHIFSIAGWFILLSSVAILVAPRRWHQAYSQYWAMRLPPVLVRFMAVPTFILAGVVACVAL